jgi:predicted O-methyltransferase YrrM
MDWKNIDGWFSIDDYEFYKSLIEKSKDATLVEVGSWQGRSICSILPTLEKQNYSKVYCVDIWSEEPPGSQYARRGNPNIQKIFLENIESIGLSGMVTPMKMKSVDAAKKFDDESVDIVFIDADHSYEGVMEDIKAWLPKVKVGGILSGHDYFEWGVFNAVTESLGIKNIFTGGACWAFTKVNNC